MNRRESDGQEEGSLTGRRVLTRSVFWNLFGIAAPLVAAVFTIPVLLAGLGVERFGVLALVWVAIGYFSLFDLGLGRALTKLVADRLGGHGTGDLKDLIWTAAVVMVVLGGVGGLVAGLLSYTFAYDVLNISPELQRESFESFLLVALGIPFVVSTAGWRGVLEAYQRFDLIALIRLPLGVFTFVGPVITLLVTPSLTAAVAVLVVGRIVAAVATAALVFQIVPSLRSEPRFRRVLLRPLLAVGGWMTVSNVVSPAMVYFDRFFIGVLISTAAVAYYATPYEVVWRVLVVPSAILGVLFPAFSVSLAGSRVHVGPLFRRGGTVILLLVVPVLATVIALAPEGLALWLGEEFVGTSTVVLRWLSIGVLCNAIGRLPFTVVQAAGRPDLTAKLHLLEIVLYLPALWWSIRAWGIGGAAIVWTARMALDMTALLFVAGRVVPELRNGTRRLGQEAVMGVIIVSLGWFVEPLGWRVGYLVALATIGPPVVWWHILQQDDRVWLGGYVGWAKKQLGRASDA